jgi:hypothetical protein
LATHSDLIGDLSQLLLVMRSVRNSHGRMSSLKFFGQSSPTIRIKSTPCSQPRESKRPILEIFPAPDISMLITPELVVGKEAVGVAELVKLPKPM